MICAPLPPLSTRLPPLRAWGATLLLSQNALSKLARRPQHLLPPSNHLEKLFLVFISSHACQTAFLKLVFNESLILFFLFFFPLFLSNRFLPPPRQLGMRQVTWRTQLTPPCMHEHALTRMHDPTHPARAMHHIELRARSSVYARRPSAHRPTCTTQHAAHVDYMRTRHADPPYR